MTREDARKLLRDFSLASEYHIAMVVDSWEREAISVAIKALEEPEQRWIPCSEKLPEAYTDVIVTNGIGIYIGWINPTDKVWRVDSESEYFIEDIIAWMPCPKPYGGDQE